MKRGNERSGEGEMGGRGEKNDTGTGGSGDTETRKKRVQGFDVGLTDRYGFAFALVDQGGNQRVEIMRGRDLKADSVIEFLRQAWAEGFGGGRPGALMLDGAVRRYDQELMAFLRERGVLVGQLPSAGRGMRGKLERVLAEWRAGTPAPRVGEAQP